MSTDDKIEKLIDALNTKTKEQMIVWEETAERGVFQTAMTNSGVLISRHIMEDEDGRRSHEYILSVINNRGKIVERIRRENDEKMKELYDNARRMAMNADSVIENMLYELNSLSKNVIAEKIVSSSQP